MEEDYISNGSSIEWSYDLYSKARGEEYTIYKKELEQALHQAAKNTTKTRDYSNVKPKRTESFLTPSKYRVALGSSTRRSKCNRTYLA